MTDASIPSTYSQFTLFRELSNSLYPHDWHTFVETWHSMVAVNAPVAEFTYNLIPFFSNARKLQPVFQRYMKFAQQDANLLSTMTTVLMSTPLLDRIQGILQAPRLFQAYVVALKMDDASASHTQVMNSIQAFLATLPAHTRLAMQRVFAEAEASDSLGLTPSTQETLFNLLHGDTQLYIDVLSALQLNQSRNWAWDAVVAKVKTLVLAKKPPAWADTEQFLERLHWGGYQDYDEYSGGYVDEYDGDDWYEEEANLGGGDGYDYYYAQTSLSTSSSGGQVYEHKDAPQAGKQEATVEATKVQDPSQVADSLARMSVA
ncbi:hypothetical protein CPC16_008264 [Podila verticillata]|nr:hypothetical protein CPC16_008264 [Podila verticillata]